MHIIEVNVLVVGDKPNLDSFRHPSGGLVIPALRLMVPSVKSSQNSVAECLQKALVVRFLRHINDKEPSQSDRFSSPVFLGHNKFNRTAVKLGALISVHANALGARGAEILWWGIVGMRTQVADEFVASRSEHHEWVDVRATSATSWGACVSKVQYRNVRFARLE